MNGFIYLFVDVILLKYNNIVKALIKIKLLSAVVSHLFRNLNR